MGEDTLDTTPAGIYRLLSSVALHAVLELVCELVSEDVTYRPEATEVLTYAFLASFKEQPLAHSSVGSKSALQRKERVIEACRQSEHSMERLSVACTTMPVVAATAAVQTVAADPQDRTTVATTPLALAPKTKPQREPLKKLAANSLINSGTRIPA